MDLLQRLPKAIFVTAVAFLFFGGTVGVVVAAGEEPMPETFGIAPPMQGDRWSYQVSQTVHDADFQDESHEVTYEWLESDVVFDRHGIPHHVQPLFDETLEVTAYVAHETGRVIATSTSSDGESERWGLATFSLLGDEYTLARTTSEEYNHTYVGFKDEPVPCGFISDFQGKEVVLSGKISVGGDCAPWRPDLDELDFLPVSVESIQGVQALKLEAQVNESRVELWFVEMFPYPVKMAFTFSEQAYEQILGGEQDRESSGAGLTLQLEAVGFEGGTEPWGVPNGALPEPFGPLAFAPVTSRGPNHEEVDHPYPFHVAFENARNDPTYQDLRDFMENNPDAMAVLASHILTEDMDRNVDTHSWYYLVADQDSLIAIRSDKSVPRDDYSGLEFGPVDEFMTEDHATTTLPPSLTGNGWQVNFVIPEQTPTLHSLQDAYIRTTGSPAVSYGFMFLTFEDETLEQPHIFVGRNIFRHEGGSVAPGASGSAQVRHHFFELRNDGSLVQEMRLEYDHESEGYEFWTQSSPLANEADDDVPRREVSRAVWAAPSPEAAAGISFVALLIGATYWLWPALKAMPVFSLFSRVRPDQMMENPIRSDIYEVIKAEPGIHYQELVRRIGKGASVVDHHLRKLDLGNFISVQKGQGFTCFFPKGVVDHRIMMVVPILRTEGASRVLREVVKRPGQSVSELARSVGIAKSTVSYHVGRLRKVNLLEQGRALIPSADAKQALTYAA